MIVPQCRLSTGPLSLVGYGLTQEVSSQVRRFFSRIPETFWAATYPNEYTATFGSECSAVWTNGAPLRDFGFGAAPESKRGILKEKDRQ